MQLVSTHRSYILSDHCIVELSSNYILLTVKLLSFYRDIAECLA